MRILVTGSRGFIGSHLLKKLEDENQEIIYLGKADIRKPDIYSLAGMGGIDRIYHLASNPSPVKYTGKLLETIETNVIGTENMLELAKKTGARVLFTSTVDAGNYFSPENPRSGYVDSKKVAEDLSFIYRQEYGVDVRVLRLYSVYGPGMEAGDGRVIPNFICGALRGHDITISGDGSQFDSFCYVDDMVPGLINFMESDKNSFNMPIEIGYYPPIRICDLASKIIELSESESRVVNSFGKGVFADRCPDLTKAVEIIGWKPETSIEGGLFKTIEYFRDILEDDPEADNMGGYEGQCSNVCATRGVLR